MRGLPFAFALVLATTSARADRFPCARSPLRNVVPACVEAAYFTSAGVSSIRAKHGDETLGTFAFGAEATVALFRYHGFPSGAYGGHRGDAEVRAGYWLLAVTRLGGGLVEAGLKIHDGALYHASWGTFDLRLGAGYGAFAGDRAPHATITVGYGVNSVVARYRAQSVPSFFAESSIARVVLTVRRTLQSEARTEVFVGVELSPTFFLPPVTWFRLAGGPPH